MLAADRHTLTANDLRAEDKSTPRLVRFDGRVPKVEEKLTNGGQSKSERSYGTKLSEMEKREARQGQ